MSAMLLTANFDETTSHSTVAAGGSCACVGARKKRDKKMSLLFPREHTFSRGAVYTNAPSFDPTSTTMSTCECIHVSFHQTTTGRGGGQTSGNVDNPSTNIFIPAEQFAVHNTITAKRTHLNDFDAPHRVHFWPYLQDAGVGHCYVRIAAIVDLDRARRLLHFFLRVDEKLHPNAKVAEFSALHHAL